MDYFFILAAVISNFFYGAGVESLITGGTNTTIEEYPYQVSIEYYGVHVGGASIISNTIALTAAHVTDRKNAGKITIRAGTTTKGKGGDVHRINSFTLHPKYVPLNKDFDVSVLKLQTPLVFGVGIQPIPLSHIGEEVSVGKLCTITGWGRHSLKEQGEKSDVLQAVDVPKISNADCKRKYRNNPVTERMLCYGFENGSKDACRGDSGGPLACDGILFGIISWGVGCGGRNKPGVYTRISHPDIQSYILDSL